MPVPPSPAVTRSMRTSVSLSFDGPVTAAEVAQRLREIADKVESATECEGQVAGRHDTSQPDRPWWWTYARWP